MRLVTTRGQHHTGKASRLAKPRQRGLTLIELLVALAVLVISITWAIPSFQQFSARNEVAAEVMRIRTALAVAKNTAITRRTKITVCPTPDKETCVDDWSQPLMMFENLGDRGVRDLANEPVLKVLKETDVASVSFSSLLGTNHVRFPSSGWPRGYNGTFIICKEPYARRLIMSSLGRTKDKSLQQC